jgi:hypothetical protein
MNTNIVKYILETTNMNQTEIANKLKPKKRKGSDKETKVTQASISQWSRGDKLPSDRAIELLQIAGIYWELEYVQDYDNISDYRENSLDEPIPTPEWMRDTVVDPRWHIVVKTEQNQNDWYNFIDNVLSPKKFKNIQSESNDNDFVKFARECLFHLIEAGFIVPESPESIKSSNSILFNLFRKWMHRITVLQYWCASSLPQDNYNFPRLYLNLPKIALAQCIVGSNYQVPEKTDPLDLRNFVEEVSRISKTSIDSYYAWEAFHMESFFGEDSFNEILIYSKDGTNDNISQSSLTTSSDEIQKDDDKYLSYSEKKILNGIQNNEKLLKEILEKLNKLTNNGEIK